RPAAAVGIEQHADDPLRGIRSAAAQRVLAHEPWVGGIQYQIDVRARGPLRQLGAAGIGERERHDALGDRLAADDLEVGLDLPVRGLAPRHLLDVGHDDRRTGIELYWLRNSARTRVGSPSRARSGKRSIVCWIQSFSSRRARLAPRQKCRPRPPKAWCWSRPSRVMSKRCGSAKTRSSRLDARYQSRTRSFSLIVWPCSSTSEVAARAMNAKAGKQRSPSST